MVRYLNIFALVAGGMQHDLTPFKGTFSHLVIIVDGQKTNQKL